MYPCAGTAHSNSNSYGQPALDTESLFWELFRAGTEDAVAHVIDRHPAFQDPENWKPYGQNESNFGVVENQQASPIPALVEKIINSIDAILTRRCHEEGIDPRASKAPRSVDEAVTRFFPDSGGWDLVAPRPSA